MIDTKRSEVHSKLTESNANIGLRKLEYHSGAVMSIMPPVDGNCVPGVKVKDATFEEDWSPTILLVVEKSTVGIVPALS